MSQYDPLDVQGQQRDREAQALRDRLDAEQVESDLKWLLGSKRGRRIVWRLLSESGVFRSSFSTNAMQMSFNEGHRNYGLGMLNAVHRVSPEAYPVMLAENAPMKEPDA